MDTFALWAFGLGVRSRWKSAVIEVRVRSEVRFLARCARVASLMGQINMISHEVEAHGVALSPLRRWFSLALACPCITQVEPVWRSKELDDVTQVSDSLLSVYPALRAAMSQRSRSAAGLLVPTTNY